LHKKGRHPEEPALLESLKDRSPVGANPAREELQDTAFIQDKRVIVDVHREQARSYKGM
jgi:hypothetical protein